MGYSKDQLLARLQDLAIDYAKYEHPVVLTVEEQSKYVGSTEGVLSKNLFLKDKKQRFYIVSAMADTKVDMKVLSQRLGLGKGGVRMAPEELLGEILQVPLGCVTPFAVVNESARDVSLLLDQKFKSHARCIFHPLSNDVSISLNTTGLDKFLQSVGREPVYVNLEANPAVGKDHPPDLAAYVPSVSTVLPEAPQKSTPSQVPAAVNAHVQNKPVSTPAKASKPSSNSQNAKDNKVALAVQPPSAMKDPEKFIEEIFEKTSALLLSEIKEDSIKQHGEQLGSVLADSLRKRLKSDLTHLAIMYKNTAYAEGFYAGTHHQPKRL